MSTDPIPLLPSVFIHLLRQVIAEANGELVRQGLADAVAPPLTLEMTRAQLFGTGDYHPRRADVLARRQTIANALQLRMADRYGAETWLERFGIRGFYADSRKLQDAYADWQQKWKNPGHKAGDFIYFPCNYLSLHLDFLNMSSPEDLLATEALPAADRDFQRLLFLRYWCVGRDRRPPLPGLESEPGKILGYTCFFFDDEIPTKLHEQCLALFELRGDQPTRAFLLRTPSGDDYQGELTLNHDRDQATLHLLSCRDDHHKRPFLMVITKGNRRPFDELAVCVGPFISINTANVAYTGVMVLQQHSYLCGEAPLDPNLVRAYLRVTGDHVKSGGFHTAERFRHHVQEAAPDWQYARDLVQRLAGRYFACYILSKKPRGEGARFDRLERALFHFGAGGKFTCYSAYPPNSPLAYEGYLTYHSLHRVLLHFRREGEGVYTLPLELREGEPPLMLSGVYSGFTQKGMPAGGRARFYEIDQRGFDTLPPRIMAFDDPEATLLFRQYPDLRDFLGGRRDAYLDDPGLLQPDLRFLTADAGADLGPLPGVYYYYRTRTIKAHIREVKRFPVLIGPDGKVSVKVTEEGDHFEAEGILIRKTARAYLHINKKNRYGGLAIIYPDWNAPLKPGAVIPGVYVTTTDSSRHLMAGRLFFRRLSDDSSGRYWAQLQPADLNLDELDGRPDVAPEELPLLRHLCGQINSYIAIRTPEAEQPHQNYGRELFLAACYIARHLPGEAEWAVQTLKRALLYGGFRDIAALRREIAEPDGDLFPLQAAIGRLPDDYDPHDHLGQDRDVHWYLKGLLGEVMG